MERVESYNCGAECMVGGKWSSASRSERNCARPDLPPVSWRATLGPRGDHALWMGLPERPDLAVDRPDWKRPVEPMEEGCPGAWYRCGFLASLEPYLPRILGQSWIPSPLASRPDTSRLILDAVALYMTHRQRADVHADRLQLEIMRDR